MKENLKFMDDSTDCLSNTMRLPNNVFSTSGYPAMDDKKESIERRKHPRFKVKRGAVAAIIRPSLVKEFPIKDMPMNDSSIATAPKNIQMGQIINISNGGLAFRHINGNDDNNKLFDLDILSVQDKFYLKKVPVQIVWASHAVIEPSFSLLKSEELGLRFEELNPRQKSQLDFFLQNYTLK